MIVIEGLNHVGITVSNLEKSIEFYRDLFDFEVIEKLNTAGKAYLRMGDIIISLTEIASYKNPEGTKNCLSFYVDEEDFDDALDEIEDLEIKIIYGPENLRGGQTVIFLDPDKNQIELSYPRIG